MVTTKLLSQDSRRFDRCSNQVSPRYESRALSVSCGTLWLHFVSLLEAIPKQWAIVHLCHATVDIVDWQMLYSGTYCQSVHLCLVTVDTDDWHAVSIRSVSLAKAVTGFEVAVIQLNLLRVVMWDTWIGLSLPPVNRTETAEHVQVTSYRIVCGRAQYRLLPANSAENIRNWRSCLRNLPHDT
jgi:hypothetical protein